LDWWGSEIERKGRAQKTGRNHLDVLAGVFHLAVDREMIAENPVDAFRATLRRRNRTARGRSESESGAEVRPIEHAEEVDAFVAASRAEGGAGHVVDLLLLDAGLRLGEATAITWADVWWGSDANDTTRGLTIKASRSRGKHLGLTKSGRARRVAMSRRLRGVLQEHHLRCGRPEEGPVAVLDHDSYRGRHFARVCKAAKLGPRSPKDLRDTYASQLLTVGVQLGYISARIGHADVAVTARHCARWAGGNYRSPLVVEAGELPADLLARLARVTTKVPTTGTVWA
jgi:integrase